MREQLPDINRVFMSNILMKSNAIMETLVDKPVFEAELPFH
jgi:hypothetical protein